MKRLFPAHQAHVKTTEPVKTLTISQITPVPVPKLLPVTNVRLWCLAAWNLVKTAEVATTQQIIWITVVIARGIIRTTIARCL